MGFEVIPAIDVSAGRLARFTASGPEPVGAFGGDPLAAARSFVGAGARWVHVIDMDLAFAGEARNLEIVRAIADLGIRVQASGGVASVDEISAMRGAGAERVVLGSAALVDRSRVEAAVDQFGERVAIGLEVSGGRLSPRGRGLDAELELGDTLEWLSGTAVPRFVVTSVERVDTLEGAERELPVSIARRTGRPVLASGGVASLEDLRRLAATGELEGAIVGRALLEGDLDLAAALRGVSSADPRSPRSS